METENTTKFVHTSLSKQSHWLISLLSYVSLGVLLINIRPRDVLRGKVYFFDTENSSEDLI